LTSPLPHLFELSKRALEALQAAQEVLLPAEQREEERGSIEAGLAQMHLRRAMLPLVELITGLSCATGAGAAQVDAEALH
jgi:hypothetical protein